MRWNHISEGMRNSKQQPQISRVKKFTLKLETVYSSKVLHRKRQYTHWATPLRRATFGILCPVHIKYVVGMLSWRIWQVRYGWAFWCSTLLYLSYQLKTSWYDFNRREGTAEQGLFRYLLHERMTAFTHNASVNYCAMWNVEYHCDSEVEATNISLSQILPPNMMKSQQYNLKLLIRHQIITK